MNNSFLYTNTLKNKDIYIFIICNNFKKKILEIQTMLNIKKFIAKCGTKNNKKGGALKDMFNRLTGKKNDNKNYPIYPNEYYRLYGWNGWNILNNDDLIL